MRDKKISFYAIGFTLITVLFTLAVKKIDVKVIGQTKTKVGFSFINDLLLHGYSEFWDKVSVILGYVSFLVLGVLALVGLVQLIKRKSILKVDKEIIGAGVIFVITLIIYFIFNKIAINYRPVMLPGETELEASYPSSHTMMAVVICGVALYLIGDYIKNRKLQKILRFFLEALVFLMIIFRFLSGVHWFTDIVAGVLFGITLLLWYGVAVDLAERKFKNEYK